MKKSINWWYLDFAGYLHFMAQFVVQGNIPREGFKQVIAEGGKYW